MKPTGLAARVAGRGASVALSVFKRIVGFDLLADLAEFFNAFSGMVDGFQARAKRVNNLLADPHTCFLVVCGPQGEPIDEAVYFHRKLVEAKLPFGGVIVNKVHYPAERLRGDGGDLEAALAEKLGDEDLAERVAENFADYQALAERDAAQHRAPGGGAAHQGRDPRPLSGRGRPRPRRPRRDQPLPLRRGENRTRAGRGPLTKQIKDAGSVACSARERPRTPICAGQPARGSGRS